MAILIRYAAMMQDINQLKEQITAIQGLLGEEITVTSLRGATNSALDTALNKFKNSLQAIEEPLGKMCESIENVRQIYTQREVNIQNGLNGGGDGGTMSSNGSNSSRNNYTV